MGLNTSYGSAMTTEINLDSVHTLILDTFNNSSTTTVPSDASNDVELEIPLYTFILVPMFYILMLLCGTTGNAMVIIVVLRNVTMLNSTNVFLLNLSVADICVLLVCVPTAMSEFFGKDVWYLGEAMCKLVPFLENTVALSSGLTILAISFERFYAICRPLLAQYKCTIKRTVKVIIAIWVTAISLNLPFFAITFLHETTAYNGERVKTCRTHVSGILQRSFIISLVVVGMVIPMLILIYLYGCIIRKLMTEDADGFGGLGMSQRISGQSQRQRKQVVVMLIAVIVIFFISLLPFRVVSLWLVYASDSDVIALGLEGYLNLLCFARVMFFMNSALNPIIYNMFSSKFRKAFYVQFGRCDNNYNRHSHIATSSTRSRLSCKTENVAFKESFKSY